MSEAGSKEVVTVGVGSVIAMLLSTILNHSFWWGLLHSFCGWLYVLYVLAHRSHEILPALKAAF